MIAAELPKYAPEGAVIPGGSMPSVSLLRRYGVDAATLIRWEGYGWIEPLWPRSGSGSGRELWWGPGAVRMVALVSDDRARDRARRPRQSRRGGGWPRAYSHVRRQLFAACWRRLSEFPDVIWLVDVSPDLDDPQLVGCWTLDQVAEAFKLAPGPSVRVVSPPLLPD